MSEKPSKHEETIQPISPGFGVGEPAAEQRRARAGVPASPRGLWLAAGGGLLMVALLGVFFALPAWLARETVEPSARQPVAADEPVFADGEEALTAQELAALEAKSQRDLARLLTQQGRIEALGAERWSPERWARYMELARQGDDAYLLDDFAAAASAYAEALAIGEALVVEADEIVADALLAGQQAIETGDAGTAIRQFNIVLGIDAEHTQALAGKLRAERLPSVLELVRQARDLEQDGELPEAIESYRQALQIDPDWEPAREALATALGNREQYEFDQLLSKGYAALGDEDYRDAVESFTRALELRPEASEARDGLFQAEEGLKRGQIALAEIRALAFERRELWGEAIAQYEAALATDPTLDYAITGLARAQRRQDLDVKITNLIENPRLLFDDSILAEAGELLEQARAVDDPGIRIQEQIEDLGRLVRLASTPQRVVLESDALTQVTVYRVGELGSFTSREIDLRPGEYVAIGSRNGYRDVRKSFTVLPGREAEPIRIVCVEPI